jgi:L-threonylcarbamoyladenylate synthase
MTGETIPAAVRVLEQGGLVIYPTETCYGLGGDATKLPTIRRIYKLKHRRPEKPLSVIVDSLDMIKDYALITREVEELVKEYMPGPLTLIVKNKAFPSALCGEGIKVGFRIPDHVIALELVKQFGKPITATSANLSGSPNPYGVPDLPVDFVINYGELPRTPPSTVYDTTIKKVIRQGPIKL